MIEISIIMPVYNAQKYIKHTLDSLLCQSFKDFEVICINDGSTDKSLEILEKYSLSDSRIVVFNQKNQGCAVSRNVGLSKARGKYIMFCDSDDFYAQNMCEKMYNAAESHNVSYVMCGTNVIYNNRQELKAWDDEYFFIENDSVKLIDSEFRISTKNHVLWNRIWRKSVIDEFGIKFPIQPLYDDTIFCKEYIFASDNLYMISDKLYNYVRVPNSFISDISGKVKKDALCILKSLIFLYDFLIKNDLYEKYCSDYWAFFANTYKIYDGIELNIIDKIYLEISSFKFVKKFDIKRNSNKLNKEQMDILEKIIKKECLLKTFSTKKIKRSLKYLFLDIKEI